MATQITLTYCGMSGTGATVKLAKQDAARKIESVLDGFYTAYLIRQADRIGLVWREPTGYNYKIIDSDTNAGQCFGNSAGADQKDAISACARHMAQNAGSYAGLEQYLSRADMRDLDNYFGWQSRYAAARNAGYDDDACRTMADQRTIVV